MIQDNILYTDGHDVTVTNSMFHVRNMSYHLRGITKHGLHILKPHRLPAFLLVLIGMFMLISGVLNLIPEQYVPSMIVMGVTLSEKVILLVLGSVLILVGVLIAGLLRERYAVRISTAEGEKDVVVSEQKEYVTQIISALNKAFNFRRK